MFETSVIFLTSPVRQSNYKSPFENVQRAQTNLNSSKIRADLRRTIRLREFQEVQRKPREHTDRGPVPAHGPGEWGHGEPDRPHPITSAIP